jgi:hypothetical protein
VSFLSPLFLFGLAALAVPVLLHLIQRERRRIVPFPSLMFLQRIPYKSVRRRQIRHWLLLALRLAALLLVVLAFARPFLRQGGAVASAAGGPRELVVLLDQSYSMGYGDRWTRARAAAASAIDSLATGERASVVLFATEAAADIRSSSDRSRLRRAVDEAAPSAGATRYGPALRLAQSILAASSLPRRELILISDFQRSGWNRDDAVRLPAGTTLTPVDVGSDRVANTAVTAVTLQRTTFAGQERVAISATVANRGDAAARDLAVSLEVDGRAVETQRVAVEPRAGASVAFAPFTVSASSMRGIVATAADALPIDDRFAFVISPSRVVPVTLAGRSADERPGLYLTRALSIGTSPRFDVASRAVDALPDRVADGAVLVLNDVVPAASTLASIRRSVEDGAGLIVVAAERAAWSGDAGLLPGVPAATVDRPVSRLGLLANLNTSHPVFEPFQGTRRGDFSSARFFRYRTLTLRDDASVVARFDDGSVALAERRIGRGRVMLWTSTLDTEWNDLPLRPVFLPFVHGLVRFAGRYADPSSAFTVGDVLDPATLPPAPGSAAATSDAVALAPDGQRVPIGTPENRVLALEQQGFYELRRRNDAAPVLVAANVDPAESDPARIPPAEISAAVGSASAAGGADARTAMAPADEERQTGFWWYLLLATVLVLAGETVVANRYAKTGSG